MVTRKESEQESKQYGLSLSSASFYLSLLLGFQMALPTFRACLPSVFSQTHNTPEEHFTSLLLTSPVPSSGLRSV